MLIVYSLADKETRNSIAGWKKELSENNFQGPTLVLANKCDAIPAEQLKERLVPGAVPTSAFTGEGREEVLLSLVKLLGKHGKLRKTVPRNIPVAPNATRSKPCIC